MNKTALGLVGEAEELVTCEVAGMGGRQIKKTSFLIVVAQINEGCEMFSADAHSDRTSNVQHARVRAASSGSACIANPF